MLSDFLLGDAQGSKDSSQCDTRSAVDVVIEGADLVAIALEDRDGVDVCEVLPLDAAFRVTRLHCINELVNEGHVLFAADAVLAQAEIKRVVEQDRIIRAD